MFPARTSQARRKHICKDINLNRIILIILCIYLASVGCVGGPRVNDSVVVGDADTAAIIAKIGHAETRLIGLNKEIQQHTYRRMEAGRDTTIGLTGGIILAAFAAWRLSLVAMAWLRHRWSTTRTRRITPRAVPHIMD